MKAILPRAEGSWPVHFFVRGKPRPKGSPSIYRRKSTGRPFVRESTGEIAWEKSVRVLAGLARRRACLVMALGPMRVELEFLLAGPKRPTAAGAAIAPDIDKLARAVLDALSGELYADDRQVIVLIACKRLAEPAEHPGVHITATAVGSRDA